MKISSILAATFLATVAGCSGASDKVAPTPTHFLITPASALYFVASPGGAVDPASLPSVHIQSEYGPAAGVVVTFTIKDGGAPSTYSAATGKDGNARLDSWRVGSTSGAYTATATLPTGASLEFTAFVRTKAVAAYDRPELAVQNHIYPPGHLVLFDDGTYVTYTGPVASNEISRSPDGKFSFVSSAVVNFTTSFPWTGLSSNGTISGNTIAVRYFNEEFDDSVYTRRN